jgi:predicted sulfurtransferase
MYCTGGVRCERVSMLVQSLYPEKRVYQLQGGIQTYLASQHVKSVTGESSSCAEQVEGSTDKACRSTTHLFQGKNFVFDPRRTDPLHGPTAVVGKCLVCSTAHDDYDNGHAPSEQKEARCNTCRMLILACNTCRPNYACWGEQGAEGQSSDRPLLYCGLDRCVHEGVAPLPELVAPPSDSIES